MKDRNVHDDNTAWPAITHAWIERVFSRHDEYAQMG